MARRACLAIGVSTVNPPQNEALSFPYLDGAIVAARNLGAWALRSGFGADNVRVVDDGLLDDGRSHPVTCERVQQAVDELFPAGSEPVLQLILMFCGHGLTDENMNSISWLLSDSLEKRYRIVADRFYGELQLYGVERITLISDACREPPKGFNLLRVEPVRGIFSPVNARVPGPRTDRFAACQDGKQGFMVSDPMSAAPGKCVFSGVVADALWGLEPSAFDQDIVTTSSLGSCVVDRAKERAEDYLLTMIPDCYVYPKSVTLFNRSTPPDGPPELQAWPPTLKKPVIPVLEEPPDFLGFQTTKQFDLTDLGDLGGLFSKHQLDFDSLAERGGVDLEAVRSRLRQLGKATQEAPHVDVRRLAEKTMEFARTKVKAGLLALEVGKNMQGVLRPRKANLIVTRADSVVVSQLPALSFLNGLEQSAFYVDPTHSGQPGILKVGDSSFAPFVPYDRLYSVVTTSSKGDVFQAYGNGMDDIGEIFERTVEFIQSFAAGRISAADIDRITALMRRSKHEDPMLGVLCAHLYRTTADIDSIRRMAYYYGFYQQPVPFDIILLGEMQVSRDESGALRAHIPTVPARTKTLVFGLPQFVTGETPAVTAPVGGRCPWIGLGWDYVAEPRPEWSSLVEGLAEISPYIPRSGCTVFDEPIAHRLAELWGLNHTTRSR